MATKKASETGKAAAKPAAAAKGGGDLAAQFAAASENVKKLKKEPDNETKLRLYSLYKQASEGDVKGARPGMFDFVGGAKYDAWAKLKGSSQEMAMKKYVDLVKQLGA
jgi:acyl-CoA-binding protein